MTRDEAKRILLAYRQGTSDGKEPEIVAALELARTDEELRVWLESMGNFHTRVREVLRGLPPSPGLRDAILARRKVVRGVDFGRRSWLAAAAAIGLLLVFTFYYLGDRPDTQSVEDFRKRMVQFALREYRMDILTNDLTAVRDYLSSRSAPSDFPLPPKLVEQGAKGGASLSWQGKPVAMVCFKLDAADTIYLFVTDQTTVPNAAAVSGLEVQEVKGLTTATWSKADKLYVLAAPAGAAQTREWLATL